MGKKTANTKNIERKIVCFTYCFVYLYLVPINLNLTAYKKMNCIVVDLERERERCPRNVCRWNLASGLRGKKKKKKNWLGQLYWVLLDPCPTRPHLTRLLLIFNL